MRYGHRLATWSPDGVVAWCLEAQVMGKPDLLPRNAGMA